MIMMVVVVVGMMICSTGVLRQHCYQVITIPTPVPTFIHRLVGLVVKASASGATDPELESRLRRDFSGSSHTSDSKIGTPVATLPGAWHYRVSAGTGRPDVTIL